MIFYEKQSEDFKVYRTEELSYPSHLHENIELFYCENGKIDVTCNFEKNTLKEGMWMIVMPNTEHSYISVGKCQGVMIFIKPTYLSSLSQHLDTIPENPFVICNTGLLRNCIEVLLHPQDSYPGLLESKGALYLIMGTLFRLCRFTEHIRTPSELSFSDILDYISKNFRHSLTLEDIATKFGLNYSYFSRMFKKKFGCTFRNYLNELRIDHAKYMLISTTLPITDICFECGFTTQRSFNRAFLSVAGCTPKEYRKKSGISTKNQGAHGACRYSMDD